MEKAKVYFTDMRVRPNGRNLLDKLAALLEQAGMGKIDFNGRFTAIKIHFGEPGNLSFLRPNFARAVVDEVKKRGGKPFLTDCNTLYVGRRGAEKTPSNTWSPLIRTVSRLMRPAATSSSVTDSREPTTSRFRCRTENLSARRKSDGR